MRTADDSPAYFAAGYGGQLIEVVPGRDLVVVVATAGGDRPAPENPSWLTDVVDRVIAPPHA